MINEYYSFYLVLTMILYQKANMYSSKILSKKITICILFMTINFV